jgi:hypothetical protein
VEVERELKEQAEVEHERSGGRGPKEGDHENLRMRHEKPTSHQFYFFSPLPFSRIFFTNLFKSSKTRRLHRVTKRQKSKRHGYVSSKCSRRRLRHIAGCSVSELTGLNKPPTATAPDQWNWAGGVEFLFWCRLQKVMMASSGAGRCQTTTFVNRSVGG